MFTPQISTFLNRFTLNPLFLAAMFLTVASLSMLSCGGGGGGDGDSAALISFQGTVTTDLNTTFARGANAVSGVTVNALGSSAVTDPSGIWSFEVDSTVFSGGDVQFGFTAASLTASVVVTSIPATASQVNIDFVVQSTEAVTTDAITIDGLLVETPETEDTEDTEPTEDNACTRINQTNVAILNSRAEIIDTHACDRRGDSFDAMTIGNPSQTAFTYEVTTIPPLLVVVDGSGTLSAGGTAVIRVEEDCDQLADLTNFDPSLCEGREDPDLDLCQGGRNVEVRVDITGLRREGEIDFTSADSLVDECGSGASVGNLTESATITFFRTDTPV